MTEEILDETTTATPATPINSTDEPQAEDSESETEPETKPETEVTE